ncbi:MAG: hypothetical protein ABSB78_08400 [Bacteroidota bacterium]
MKTATVVLVFGFILFMLPGCKDPSSEQATSPPSGMYEYNGYDSTGTPIVQGWFTIDLKDQNILDGDWQFIAVGETKNIGPQIGKGHLAGEFHNDTMSIELQPLYRDNNVGLFGILKGNEFSGKWVYSSFIGITNSGTFIAVRK